ncbi:MAG: hypothetical protein V8Q85_03240, partial [Christensenellales bacterium]
DDAYMQKLFGDVISLYRLDNANAASAGGMESWAAARILPRADLGALRGVGAYYCIRRIRQGEAKTPQKGLISLYLAFLY